MYMKTNKKKYKIQNANIYIYIHTTLSLSPFLSIVLYYVNIHFIIK